MKRPAVKKILKKTRSNGLFGLIGSVVIAAALVVAVSFVLKHVSRQFTSSCSSSGSCVKDLSGRKENVTKAVFLGRQLTIPQLVWDSKDTERILGENTPQKEKLIEVDLTKQRIYAYEADELVYEFPVSTGKWGRTPTGQFQIWVKLRYARMSGGNQALGTYYDLPNVPYVMFFNNDEISKEQGFSIHGTYWHNNFGHPMSHGCVNMRTEDVKKLYYWADPVSTSSITYSSSEHPGTLVKIYGTSPED